MLTVQHPSVLLAILLIIPVFIYIHLQFKKLAKVIMGFYEDQSESKVYRQLKRTIFLRSFFRGLSWICAVCAFAGFSWGSKKIPVQKTGSTVCFVFDISYSMTARDCPQNMSRLEASRLYAELLLPRLSDSSFSAVLAKGDGFVAIPETEDLTAMRSLLENMSPTMISTAGSSIGKGIHTALHSLSLNSAKLNYIWVFTDGDETDGGLKEALEEACKYGIPVTLVGFGKETETEITAGDGKTQVKTALRASRLKELAAAGKNFQLFSKTQGASKELIRYVDSKSTGSAFFLLNQIKSKHSAEDSEDIFSYEVVPVKRHSLFIILALIFFICSFLAEEFRFKNLLKISAVSLCLTAFTSCSGSRNEILKGSWNWYQGNFRASTAQFLNTAYKSEADSMVHQYAVFGLASTYISLEEYDAALDRLNQMMPGTVSVPSSLESAIFYNTGIIYRHKNDFTTAAEYFKKAILSDSGNIDAKINLELCNRQNEEKQGKQANSEMQGVSENNDDSSSMQNELFNLIRENEDKQWKKMQSDSKDSNIIDY